MNSPSSLRRFLWPKTLAAKAGIVALFFGVVLVGAYLAADHFTSKRLAEAWKLSEAFGLSHDLDALLGPSIAADDNAAIPLNEAGVIAQRFYIQSRQKHKLAVTADLLDHPVLLAEYESLLNDPVYNGLLEEADRRKVYRTTDVFKRPMIMANSQSAVIQHRREVSRAEHELVKYLQRAGRRDEAVRRVLRLLRTTRKWEDKEPFLVAGLMNIGIRGVAFEGLNAILREGKPMQPALHQEIDDELSRQEQIKQVLPWMIQIGAVLGSDFYEHGPWGRIPFGDLLAREGQKTTLQFAYRMQMTADKPYVEAWNEIQRLISEVKEAQGDPFGAIVYFGAGGVLASEPMGLRAFERTVARVRCLRVLNALASRGDFDADIFSLGIPKESLVDPFNGEPLRIKRTPNGPIVYSVGDDLTDNDGNMNAPPQIDVGTAPILSKLEKQ
jgi:hypothetical protein